MYKHCSWEMVMHAKHQPHHHFLLTQGAARKAAAAAGAEQNEEENAMKDIMMTRNTKTVSTRFS